MPKLLSNLKRIIWFATNSGLSDMLSQFSASDRFSNSSFLYWSHYGVWEVVLFKEIIARCYSPRNNNKPSNFINHCPHFSWRANSSSTQDCCFSQIILFGVWSQRRMLNLLTFIGLKNFRCKNLKGHFSQFGKTDKHCGLGWDRIMAFLGIGFPFVIFLHLPTH